MARRYFLQRTQVTTVTARTNSSVKRAEANEAKYHTSFAGLSEDMLPRLKVFSSEMTCEAGTLLFRRGMRDVDMFVVLSGQLEIDDLDEPGVEHVIAILRRGQFTGELDLLDNRPALVTCRAKTRTKILRVDRLVRSGSVKRVASAVGEGSGVISEVHQYFANVIETHLHDTTATA